MRCPEIEEYCEIGPEAYDQENVSPQTCDYNCIAFALGETNRPWWPAKHYPDDYEWPADLPREEYLQETIPNFITVFARRGFKVDKKSNLELQKGIEKVVIYIGGHGSPTHACRQLETGIWVSKCGDYEDIRLQTPTVLECENYGKIHTVLKRRRDGKPFTLDRILSFFKKALKAVGIQE